MANFWIESFTRAVNAEADIPSLRQIRSNSDDNDIESVVIQDWRKDPMMTNDKLFAAMLLDIAGVDRAILSPGSTVIVADGGNKDDNNSLAKHVHKIVHAVGKADRRTIGGDAETTALKDTHFVWAFAEGVPSVYVIGSHIADASPLHLADRVCRLPSLDDPAVLTDLARKVTGNDRIRIPEDLAAGMTWTRLLLSMRPGMRAADIFKRMRMLADARTDRRKTTVKLGDAGEAVVTKLSEMTGFGDAKDWGLRLAQDLEDYRQGRIEWEDLDKGILLHGAPGGGKSTFAKALAAECDVPLFVTTYSDWSNDTSFGGDTVQRVLSKSFKKWRDAAASGPIILFVDELDSIGKRGASDRADYWYGPIINAWLAFLDGAIERRNIICIGATNYMDRVDPALLRPGRLDRTVEIPMPGIDDLPGIVRHHSGIDDHATARAFRGLSPAEIELACRDARRVARRARRDLTPADLVSAAKAIRPPHGGEDKRAAIHEAGHALMAALHGMTIEHIDIDVGRVRLPTLDMVFARNIRRNIMCFLGGRAAEDILCGEISTMCVVDLEAATQQARFLHAVSGSGASGLVSIPQSEACIEKVRDTLDLAYTTAKGMLLDHRKELEALAAEAQAKRFMTGKEIYAFLDGIPYRRDRDAEAPTPDAVEDEAAGMEIGR